MKRVYVRLAGLLIAVMLVLSGCNLIGTDQIMQLEQDLAAKQKQYASVVATYDGGEITQEDVMAGFSSQYNYMSQLYAQYYGTGVSSDIVDSIKESAVQNEVQHIAIAREMEKRGLTIEEDALADVQAHADEDYQSVYDSYYAAAEGSSDEIRAKQAEYNMYVAGYTRESLYNLELANANLDKIQKVVEDEITEVTEEQLQAAYDEKVADDEELYTDNPGRYGSTMTSEGATVYWVPEGYRTVKHILVKPADDVLAAVTDARGTLKSAEAALEKLQAELDALNDDEGDDEEADDALPKEAPRAAEEIQADIDAATAGLEPLKAAVEEAESACLASVQDKLDEIYAKIGEGEDFDALIEAYGEDPGMQNEPAKTTGYYVCAESNNWDANFTAGSMALEKVGDISEKPVISSSGVHIIRYESDVASGQIALDDVREALTESTLETMKSDHFDEELHAWTEALNANLTLENFKLN